MKKIGIVANLKKPGASKLLEDLHRWLSKRDIQVWDSTAQSIDEHLSETSLVISLGGDGTLLSVAHHMVGVSIPVLGVNLGSLGFITEIKDSEIFEELNAFLLDRSEIEERIMIACSARSEKTKKERRLVALNDIVINREGLTRLLSVKISVSGERLVSFSGDGLIVATPTGSTAYSLSAGGSMVHPKLTNLIVTPLCPHTSALRPIILGGDEKISVTIRADREGEKAILSADGQENLEIDDTYIVEVTQAINSLRLIKSSKRSYFSTLREKFQLPDPH